MSSTLRDPGVQPLIFLSLGDQSSFQSPSRFFPCSRSLSPSLYHTSTSPRAIRGGPTTCSSACPPSVVPLHHTALTMFDPPSTHCSMGFSFAHNAIQLMRLDGMITGATLLGGLFLCEFRSMGLPTSSLSHH